LLASYLQRQLFVRLEVGEISHCDVLDEVAAPGAPRITFGLIVFGTRGAAETYHCCVVAGDDDSPPATRAIRCWGPPLMRGTPTSTGVRTPWSLTVPGHCRRRRRCGRWALAFHTSGSSETRSAEGLSAHRFPASTPDPRDLPLPHRRSFGHFPSCTWYRSPARRSTPAGCAQGFVPRAATVLGGSRLKNERSAAIPSGSSGVCCVRWAMVFSRWHKSGCSPRPPVLPPRVSPRGIRPISRSSSARGPIADENRAYLHLAG